MFSATDDVASFAKDVVTPVLVIQAGGDQFVAPEGEDTFCANAKNCVLHSAKDPQYGYLAEARHETFREWDTIRNPVMASYYAQLDAD